MDAMTVVIVLLSIAIGVGLASGVLICVACHTRIGRDARLAWPFPAAAVLVGTIVYAVWAPPTNPGGDDYTGPVALVLAATTFITTGLVMLGDGLIRHLRRCRGCKPV